MGLIKLTAEQLKKRSKHHCPGSPTGRHHYVGMHTGQSGWTGQEIIGNITLLHCDHCGFVKK